MINEINSQDYRLRDFIPFFVGVAIHNRRNNEKLEILSQTSKEGMSSEILKRQLYVGKMFNPKLKEDLFYAYHLGSILPFAGYLVKCLFS